MGSAAGGPGQAPPGLNVWFAGSFFLNSAARSRSFLSRGNSSCFICIPVLNVAVHVTKGKFQQLRAILSRLRRQLLSKRSLFGYSAPKSPLYKRGGAERRQWRIQRGGSPVRKEVEGSRLGGHAQRPLRTAGAERRQWRKKRGGSPVRKGVEGSRFSGDAQRPLRTARGAAPPTGSRGGAPGDPSG